MNLVIANALDRMSGGPDDNPAQANHIVPTLRSHPRPGSNSNGSVALESAGVRRLTPRECERLQGFPDDWTLIPGVKCPDSRRYAAMGNAVTTNVAEWIGRRIVAIDSTSGATAPSRTQAEETTCPRSPS